jgi:predicted Zn-dependent peptidase
LTYSCSADVNFYQYFGDLSIYIILNPTKLLKNGKEKGVLPLVINLLNDLYKNGVSEKDFTIIKGYVKGQFLIDSEDSLYHSEYNGKNILFNGDFTPFHEIYSTHYHPLKKENIHEIIQKYFKKTNMSCVLMGTTMPSQSTFEKECNQFVG